jgi:inner membrane protein
MDNVTHSLVGVTLAELALSKRPSDGTAPSQRTRLALYWSSILSSNLPDFDFFARFFAPKGEAGRLFYLLVHRGITHSLIASLPLALLSAWVCALGFKIKLTRQLFLVSWVAFLLHLFADSWNEYGVHLFSPFYNGWSYGDFVFILEPLIWCTLLPLALGRERLWKSARLFWVLPALLMLWLLWFKPYCSTWVAGGVTGFGLVQWLIYRRYPKPWVPALSLIALLAVFWVQSLRAKSELSRFFEENRAPYSQITEVMTIPAPANPFCWRVMEAFRVIDDYVVEIGTLSLWPKWVSPEDCHFRGNALPSEMSARVQAPLIPSTRAIRWAAEYRASFTELQLLRRKYPSFDAFLGYARFPFWQEQDDLRRIRFGDLRYDQGHGKGFTEFEFSETDQIPKRYPPLLGEVDRGR